MPVLQQRRRKNFQPEISSCIILSSNAQSARTRLLGLSAAKYSVAKVAFLLPAALWACRLMYDGVM